jgi:hypothetical protein
VCDVHRVFLEARLFDQQVRKFPAFVEAEDSLPCPQEPTIGAYIDPSESSSQT